MSTALCSGSDSRRCDRGCVLTEVTHDGPTLIDHRHCAAAGRSPPLGLSLVWLCSLRPWCGAADYSHRAAPHWPTLKGRPWSRGVPEFLLDGTSGLTTHTLADSSPASSPCLLLK